MKNLYCLAVLLCAPVRAGTTEPALKLDFIVDRDYDAAGIVGMFSHDDPAGLATRARSMGIKPETAERIRAAQPAEAGKIARNIVDYVFTRHESEIGAALTDIRAAWADLLPPFSETVVRSLQRPWVHPEYVCVASCIHPGLSDWHGNKVAVRYDRPRFWRRVLAHELVLSQAYQVMEKAHGGSEGLDPRQIWAFSEITAVLVLDDPALNRFWPDTPRAGGYFGSSNYPQLAEPEKRLKKLYDGRKSFDDFMDKAVPVLKTFHKASLRNNWNAHASGGRR